MAGWKQSRRLGLIASRVTLAMTGLQWTGALQVLEWMVLNQWFRLRPPEARSVPIVLVAISEADIQRARRWPLSDEQLVALLNRVKRDRPAAIGLDLYRDLPIEPGHAALLTVFKTTPNLIGIEKAVNAEGAAVPPPPILRDRGQVGINDLLLDADGIVRRNLLFIQQNEKVSLALGTKLALMYLSQQKITPKGGANGTCIHLGKAKFCRLQRNTGGYVRVDTGGYQTLSNFLRIPGGIPSVTLTQVMTNQIPASLLRNKIVLIGVKAESQWGDRFYTPYTTDSATTWAGVEIHANVVAQIISSAVDGRPLLQGLPEMVEWGWILLWASVGTILGWSSRSVWQTVSCILASVISIFSIAYAVFLLGWWAIAVAPTLAFVGAGLLSRSYWVWCTSKETNQLLECKVQERTQELIEKNSALEQARLAAEQANQELHRLANTDALTQVANRRLFNEFLEQEWHRTRLAQLPLALILIDIDCFKLYNDTYGHPAGDECLLKIARVLQSTVQKPTDLVARYGGEEFAIVLSGTSMIQAIQVSTAIQSKIKHLQIPHPQSQVNHWVTLSMGIVCMVPTAQTTVSQLIDYADHALYQAKNTGRDRAIAKDLTIPSL
ncbi:MAG: diguanylate cyclase [Oscillatoriales cyanobacterium C42_A2020_001]|nr:diguanylate cyclase [Leptolyngbyaceae cyanobacterium C42_A2020_001]